MPAVEQQRDFLLAADKRRQECGADRGETALCRPLTELLVGFAPQRHRRPDRRPRYAAARALTPDRTTDNLAGCQGQRQLGAEWVSIIDQRGPLSNPTPAVRPWPRELVFMPHRGPSMLCFV